MSFSVSYLEPQIIFPCRDIGPATATLDPRPRLWTRDTRLWTRDTRPATISQTRKNAVVQPQYNRLPITRTFRGNRKKVRVIGSSEKIAESKVKNSFY